ncbi:hypothetical protein GOP47_0017788 [Adiantum capillus-veneris]|uniref:Uncharacterized protein n=2 Tax=Adiantum capillus-veneris TaxID=13818 RepID=A0A9D4UGA5_ADICA|nr:hypothetical protein GOP47_0017788 [Adiantum capillus-veneris]
MCPMRFILVFFSLVVAGYLAFKASWFSGTADLTSTQQSDGVDVKATDGAFKRGYAKLISGLWTLVDMATGRYLWRTVASQKNEAHATTS